MWKGSLFTSTQIVPRKDRKTLTSNWQFEENSQSVAARNASNSTAEYLHRGKCKVGCQHTSVQLPDACGSDPYSYYWQYQYIRKLGELFEETQKTNGCSEKVGDFQQVTVIKDDSIIQPRASNPYKEWTVAELVPSIQLAEAAGGSCRRLVPYHFRVDGFSYPEKEGYLQNAEASKDDASHPEGHRKKNYSWLSYKLALVSRYQYVWLQSYCAFFEGMATSLPELALSNDEANQL